MAAHPKITPNQFEAAAQAYALGVPVQYLASWLGISRQALWLRLSAAGRARPKPKRVERPCSEIGRAHV